MSFLFNCCQEDISHKQQYQLETRQGGNVKVQYVSNPKDIKDWEHAGRVLRIKRSQYEQLIKKHDQKNKWTDPSFPPGPKSLGTILNVPTDCQWKRISEVIEKPQLFEGRIEPNDVIQGNLGDCYFLSAISALAESEGRITKVFGNQQFNQAGVYKVILRIDGIIQQILIDDFIPVNKANKPLFCQPNKGQIWVLLLEKAWAKAHGSYANINTGTPSQVFKAVTYAPSELRPVKKDPEHLKVLWEDILKSSLKDNPLCCGTSKDTSVDWNKIGLTPAHAYSLIDAIQLTDESGVAQKMLKIRNPWGRNEWNGEGSENDHSFWSRIPNSKIKERFVGNTPFGNDGVFFMKYQDFCNYFNQIHFCYFLDKAMYELEEIKLNEGLYTFKVNQEDDYFIELHQSGIRGENDTRLKQGLNRSTLLLAKGDNYQFIDGSLKYQEEDNTLKVHLTPGQYYVYTKFDETLNHKLNPESMSVSSYSTHLVEITPVDIKKHPDFYRKTFMAYAKQNPPRKQFENGLMWISWKLLFQKGGFAFLAFGVDSKANRKFHVNINQQDFEKLGFELENPHKGKGNQWIEILPGQQQIIVARVKNAPLQPMKFPPPMDIQIDKI